MEDLTSLVMERQFNLIIFLIILTGILGAIVIIAPGLLLNPIGDLLGNSGCPNCGDNWFWKSNGSIPLEPVKTLEKGIDYNSEHIIYAEITRGLMICEECLADPNKLDEERIERDLLSYPEGGWTPEKTAQMKEAVILYKKEKLRN